MGFRELIAFNTTMLEKQAQRTSQNQLSVWTRVLDGLYFLNNNFYHAAKGNRPLWGWLSLVRGRDAISKEVR